jgi:hypothetical protein
MAEHGPCDICGAEAECGLDWAFPERLCPRCGHYDYDGSTGWWKITSPDEMVRLSGWVREQNAAGIIPTRITPEISRRVTRMSRPGLLDRANRILSVIARDHKPDAWFIPKTHSRDPELQGVSYSRDQDELFLLFAVLVEQGFLRWGQGISAALTVKGVLAAEALGASKSSAAQGFVAMWFDPSLDDAWTNGFDPGIRAAGFRPLRLDDKDFVGGITDEIMSEIRRSRFVVADYTSQRHNVYFEAGFALGLGLTVIPTCRGDENDELKFDIRHLNTLVWDKPADLADKLEKRIRAVIGAGPDADPS